MTGGSTGFLTSRNVGSSALAVFQNNARKFEASAVCSNADLGRSPGNRSFKASALKSEESVDSNRAAACLATANGLLAPQPAQRPARRPSCPAPALSSSRVPARTLPTAHEPLNHPSLPQPIASPSFRPLLRDLASSSSASSA